MPEKSKVIVLNDTIHITPEDLKHFRGPKGDKGDPGDGSGGSGLELHGPIYDAAPWTSYNQGGIQYSIYRMGRMRMLILSISGGDSAPPAATYYSTLANAKDYPVENAQTLYWHHSNLPTPIYINVGKTGSIATKIPTNTIGRSTFYARVFYFAQGDADD